MWTNKVLKGYFLTISMHKVVQRWETHNFLQRTLTKFLDSSNLEWDELPFAFYCYNTFPGRNSTKSPFFLMFGQDLAEGCLSPLNNSNRYYSTHEGKVVLEELHKLWKHHTNHLKEMCLWNEHMNHQISSNNPKFEIGQLVMVKNHAHHEF